MTWFPPGGEPNRVWVMGCGFWPDGQGTRLDFPSPREAQEHAFHHWIRTLREKNRSAETDQTVAKLKLEKQQLEKELELAHRAIENTDALLAQARETAHRLLDELLDSASFSKGKS